MFCCHLGSLNREEESLFPAGKHLRLRQRDEADGAEGSSEASDQF